MSGNTQSLKWITKTLLLALMLLAVSSGSAQVWVRAVDIPCIVTDKQGRIVTDLSPEDFIIYANGKRQKITSFKKKLQAPLKIALLLDRSRSVSEKFPLLQHASAKFLRSIVRKNVDQVCLIAFDSHVYLLQDWTDDVDRLTGMIGELTAVGGTALFDALYKTCRDKFPADPDDTAIRVIILVTDGEDTTSRALFKQVVDRVQLSGVIIYVVGVKAESSLNAHELQGKRVLAKFRDITGGEVLYPMANRNRLDILFDQIEHELRNQYIIGFTDYSTPDGAFHKVKVKTTRKNIIARTRKKGYYATR